MDEKMHIKIILNVPYPHGLATTNRIHYYAKGFLSLGDSVEIILPRAKQKLGNPSLNKDAKGIFDGVPFIYTSGRSERTGSPVKNRVSDMRGLASAFFRIIRQRKRTDVILLVSNRFSHAVVFRVAAWFSHARLVLEKSEVPFKKSKDSFYTRTYSRYVFRLFDVILVISTYLEEYFSDKIRKKAHMIRVPVLANTSEFMEGRSGSSSDEEETIVYTGTMDQNKDGIRTLLRSFRLLLDQRPGVKLICIGRFGSPVDKEWIQNFISSNKLEEHVRITGFISRDEMLDYLRQASLLALAKPDNKQSTACFPTKLGEYLLTGNPVVVTDTGEISRYLKNNVNAFVVEPDNETAFSEAMLKALEDKEAGIEIGRKGRETALTQFDYIANVKRIRSLLKTIVS